MDNGLYHSSVIYWEEIHPHYWFKIQKFANWYTHYTFNEAKSWEANEPKIQFRSQNYYFVNACTRVVDGPQLHLFRKITKKCSHLSLLWICTWYRRVFFYIRHWREKIPKKQYYLPSHTTTIPTPRRKLSNNSWCAWTGTLFHWFVPPWVTPDGVFSEFYRQKAQGYLRVLNTIVRIFLSNNYQR